MKNKTLKKLLLATICSAATITTMPINQLPVHAADSYDSICEETGRQHDWEEYDWEEETCFEDGYIKYECWDCGEKYTKIIPALGEHSFSGDEYRAIKKGTMDSDGEGIVVCDYCFEESDQHVVIPRIDSIKISSPTYTGKTVEPWVTVKDREGNYLIHPDDFTVSGEATSVGTHQVTIDFSDGAHYDGVVKKTYKIVPKGTTISSLKSGKKSVAVKWKKQSKQTTGYQIQYSKNKSFTSAKTVTVAKNSIESKTIKNLSSKKTYYVRVRTYKTVNGKKIASKWSKTKSIKVR